MSNDTVRVVRASEAAWKVVGSVSPANLHEFRVKSHAIAYARAISWSRKSALWIDDESGAPVRQTPASMTYPVVLD